MVDLEHFAISAVGFQKTTGVSVAISRNQPSANGPLWRDHTLNEFVKKLREEIVKVKLPRIHTSPRTNTITSLSCIDP